MTSALLNEYTSDLHERRAAANELHQLELLVADTPGLILADEYMGMLTLQGRPLVIQPFEVTQLARDGQWDQTPLLQAIENKEFASIILYDREWSNERWTPEMLDTITQTYMLADIVAENKIYRAFKPVATTSIDICSGALWRLPSDGSLGIASIVNSLEFFGHGHEGSIPVYAVADGMLTRLPGWVDRVAILHEDPIRPAKKVWTYYAAMANANGTDSFVAEDFPEGIANIPVKSGQLLGYQGSWSGLPDWPKWVHVGFGVIEASGKDTFPEQVTLAIILDPAPYLGISIDSSNEHPQSLKCQ
jgi:hypothetical protein